MDELERTLGTRMNCSKTSFLNGCKISGLPPNLDLGVKVGVCLYQIYRHLLNIKFFCFFFLNYFEVTLG